MPVAAAGVQGSLEKEMLEAYHQPMRRPKGHGGIVCLSHALRELQLGDNMPEHRQARVLTEGQSPFRILRVNQAWTELCGFLPDEAVGCTFRIMQGSATSRRSLTELSQKLMAGGPAAQLLINYKKGGEPFINFLQVFVLLSKMYDVAECMQPSSR